MKLSKSSASSSAETGATPFQRETLLALQDAITAISTLVSREQDRRNTEVMRSGTWPGLTHSDPVPAVWDETFVPAAVLQSRVFDAELRTLVQQFREHAGSALFASDGLAMLRQVQATTTAGGLIHQRIGALLPDLF